MPLIHARVRLGSLLLALVAIGFFNRPASARPAEDDGWQAGVAQIVITPDKFMWMTGYGGRTKPAEGRETDLYAKATALRDPNGRTAVFISTDLIGVPIKMVRAVSKTIKQQYGLERANLMFTCSHTHCGPALDDMLSHMLAMKERDWKEVRAYQQTLNARIVRVIGAAIKDLKPARLATGIGRATFASNRRAPIGLGPYDHEVPVLEIRSADGARLRGLVFGYACHNTTMGFYKWFGDYAGYAQLTLQQRHPGCVAMFFNGCGGDQNPLPRKKLSLARKYGTMLADAVDEVVASHPQTVHGSLRTAFRTINLQLDTLPSKSKIKSQLTDGNRYLRQRAAVLLEEIRKNGKLRSSYPYPVQVWMLGNNVTWVALGGEVVVDYSLRLKRELGPGRTWVTGYANDVMAYIPSERVLKEGGYEGATSMIYYQLPTKWKTGLEQQIVKTVRTMARDLQTVRSE